MWSKIANISLVLIILVLIYINRTQTKENLQTKAAIEATQDTLHNFKTKYNSVGGYISVIEANRKLALSLLKLETEENKDLIELLDSNKAVMQASKIGTITHNYYESKTVDTLYKDVNFSHTIKTDWINEQIDIKKGVLKRTLDYRDEYIYHLDKKDNKGWFTGSTLTAYVEPKNKETRVTGLKSVSTIVDKRKPRLGSYIGGGLSLDNKLNVRPTIQVGIGLTF